VEIDKLLSNWLRGDLACDYNFSGVYRYWRVGGMFWTVFIRFIVMDMDLYGLRDSAGM
jgi:hypothetical protein